ncbi:FKBP-type peptidyl-prolyl cis-trans isomerase [Cecembia lonarensis]|uniref:Peptidyl-prolyl cis-trans isomerase n=1 Tax=Cecembia lonarensis (strain CCUG 58316 / KCTC 22772 / LW9) TaxID=1225176 RepID=K1L5Q0_CECL9|nr:FKBP-type peptidyl-prolyl cis-trans isomerase [Cecembia lonarensis]EKB47377.1 putative FKBP-type peptidyl-prolyl cis-trans isomerase [Cecembia lonarensis LW9]
MKKIKSLLFAVAMMAIAFSAMSCNKTKTTTDGIKYTYIREGSQAPKNGEYVLYHLIVKTGNDSTFISTYDQGMPAYLQFNDSIPRQSGMDEIFLGLKKGDSLAFEANAKTVFANNMPFFLQETEMVKIRVGVVDVLDYEGVEAYFTSLQEAEMKKQAEGAVVQMEIDTQIIEDYLAENNIQATRTESGLYYVIEKEGSGPEIQEGDLAFVHYAGYLMDGTIFDTSWKELAQSSGVYNEQRDNVGGYAPLEVRVGMGQVIKGWDEGLGLLKKGDKAKFIIPSPLAYGSRDSGGPIGPNSILIFDVEVTEVQN